MISSFRVLLGAAAFVPVSLIAQTIELPVGEYDMRKAAGTLPIGDVRPVAPGPVSYTHLDVYKRQLLRSSSVAD